MLKTKGKEIRLVKDYLCKVLTVGLLATAIATPAMAREMTFAGIFSATSPHAKWVEAVKTKIETISGGKMTFKLVFGGQAGSEQDTVKQVARGRLEMAAVSVAPLSLMAKEVTLTNAPYLWESVKQGTCAIGKLNTTLDPLLGKAGIKTLTWIDAGHRGIFSKSEVKVPSDLAGVKMRVEPQLADVAFARAVGATPIELPNYDAIPALETGAVNGMTWNVVVGATTGSYKIAPHVTLTNYQRQFGAVVISSALYKSLSAEEKGWLNLFNEMQPEFEKTFLAIQEALIAKMGKDGAILYRPTPEETALWKKATAGVLDELAKEIGGHSPEVLKAIAGAKASCPN